jgi:hypothetical protein
VISEELRMPTERLSMRRIRDLLRLKLCQDLSDRAIATALSMSKGLVGADLPPVAHPAAAGITR